MDALRRRLLKAVKVDGIATYKELSEALNQNPTFVQQFVTKRSPKRLFDEQIETITRILDGREAPKQQPPEPDKDAEKQLRSALTAFGVDRSDLDQVMDIVRTFARDEKPEESPSQEQPLPATPRREPARTR